MAIELSNTRRVAIRAFVAMCALVSLSATADGPPIQTSGGGGVRPDRTLTLTAQATGELVRLSAQHEPAQGETLPLWLTPASSTIPVTSNPSLEIVIAPPEDALPQQFTLAVGATGSDGLTSQAQIPWQVLAPLCSGNLDFDDDGTCAVCPAHRVPNIAKTRCDPCAANTERPPTANACVACPTGLVSEAGEGCRCPGASRIKEGACIPCPLHHDSRDNAHNCAKCPAGQQRLANMDACQACPIGQVSDSGAACTLPTLTFSTSVSSVDESAGPQLVAVRAIANAEAMSRLTIPLTFGGTASASDYAIAGTASIVLAKGARTASTTLTITPVDDGLADDNESIEIGAAASSYTVVATTISIEEPVPALLLSTTPTWIGEPSGAQDVEVKARAHAVLGSALTVPLTLGGTATAATDYTVAGSQVITIATSTREAITMLTITPAQDAVPDDGETITFGATVAGYAVTAATLTLKELAPTIVISTSPSRIDESAGMRKVVLTATTNTVSNSALALPLTIGGSASSTTDYVVRGTQTITIPATKRSGAAVLEITPVDDGVSDDLETIVFGAAVLGFQVDPATLTLEEPAPAIEIAVAPTELEEHGGAQVVTVEASANAVVGSTLTLSLNLSGTATTGTDYAVAGTRSIVVPAGSKTASTTLAITPVADGLDDDEETIEFTATVPGYAATSATLVILDPLPSLALSVSPSSVDESGGAQSVVVAAHRDAAGAPLTVPLTFGGTATATSDYAIGGTRSVSIAAMQKAGTTTLVVTPVDDSTADDGETIVIGATLADYDVKTATLTVDEPPPTIALSVSPAELQEYAGAQVATVTATTDAPFGSAVAVSLTLSGTATTAIDYAVAGTLSATIEAGQSSGSTALTITPVADTVADDSETIVIAGAAAGYQVEDATLVIRQPTIVLGVANTLLPENAGTVAVTISIVNPPTSGSYRKCRLEVVPMALDTATDRADYRLATTSVRLRADENWRSQLALTVLPDALSEATETFTLRGRCGGSSRRTTPGHAALDWRPLQLRIANEAR